MFVHISYTMTLVYQNAVGITITESSLFDITGYSSVTLVITKPDGTKLSVTPNVIAVNPAFFEYETVSGDLNQSGQYMAQIIVAFATGELLKGEIDKFVIYSPL
jgi:hypothetical protein